MLKTIYKHSTLMTIKRSQVIIKEGEESKHVYIIKEGVYSVKKNVLIPKQSQQIYEQNLLKSKTYIHKRFKNTFKKQMGLKKESELDLMLVEAGKMLGDYEALEILPSQYSTSCYSMTGVVWQVDAEELRKFKETA